MTETQWRFLKAISDRVPGGQIVELRLFPAIRQGGAECGVAVVAVEESFAAVAETHAQSLAGMLMNAGVPSDQMNLTEGAPAPDASADADGAAAVERGECHDAVATEVDAVAAGEPESMFDADRAFGDRPRSGEDRAVDADLHFSEREVRLEGDASPRSDSPRDIESAVDRRADRLTTRAHAPSAPHVAPPLGDAPTGDHEVVLAVEVDVSDRVNADADAEPLPTLDDILDLEIRSTADASPGLSRPTAKRYAVLAARYRLTLKGPDRGHWDFEITHEADAPLDTVDRVARGVARRAGDEGEPEAFSAYQLESTLAQPWWNTTT
jgi:hypothetical protein